MKRLNIPSESPLAHKVGISRAVRNGSTAHIGDIYGQTKTCIEIMRRAIEAAGGRLEDKDWLVETDADCVVDS